MLRPPSPVRFASLLLLLLLPPSASLAEAPPPPFQDPPQQGPQTYWLSPSHYPIVTSELGFSNNVNITENTVPAFSEGVRRGATSFEFTARRTADDRIALLHNDVYGDFVVESATWKELKVVQPSVRREALRGRLRCRAGGGG